MKKLFLSLALLVPTLSFGAITLETSFQENDTIINETFTVEEGEHIRCSQNTVTIDIVAQTQEDASILVKAEIFHNDVLVSAPEIRCELDTPARIECASTKGEGYSFTITARKA